jgi:serine/threonine kinase PknH
MRSEPIPQPVAVRPGMPKAFDEVTSGGMAQDPKDRDATAGDLAAVAHDALAARDQDKAATVPGSAMPTPSPFVVASSQPPYPPPPPPPPVGPPGPGGWGPGGPGAPPPGGPPPWQPPPSGPMPPYQPPNRNWVPIIIAAVVAFLLVVGGVVAAVVLLNNSGGKSSNNATSSSTTASSSQTTTSSKTRTSTSRTAPSTSTSGQSDASARLMTLLPEGYGAGACKAIAPVTDAFATVDCEKNTQPGGPEVARYSLFPDQPTLDRHFASAIKEDDELVMCPGANVQSPTTWHYTSTPDKVEGQVACGTYKGGPDVLWTRNADLLLADGQGGDLPALHDWWLKYG